MDAASSNGSDIFNRCLIILTRILQVQILSHKIILLPKHRVWKIHMIFIAESQNEYDLLMSHKYSRLITVLNLLCMFYDRCWNLKLFHRRSCKIFNFGSSSDLLIEKSSESSSHQLLSLPSPEIQFLFQQQWFLSIFIDAFTTLLFITLSIFIIFSPWSLEAFLLVYIICSVSKIKKTIL